MLKQYWKRRTQRRQGSRCATFSTLMLDAGFEPNAKNPFGGTMLHAFVAYATPGATRVLIEHGAKRNAPDWRGQLPIYWAAWRSSPEMIELLISKGADVNARHPEQGTPLRMAKAWEKWRNVRALERAGGTE